MGYWGSPVQLCTNLATSKVQPKLAHDVDMSDVKDLDHLLGGRLHEIYNRWLGTDAIRCEYRMPLLLKHINQQLQNVPTIYSALDLFQEQLRQRVVEMEATCAATENKATEGTAHLQRDISRLACSVGAEASERRADQRQLTSRMGEMRRKMLSLGHAMDGMRSAGARDTSSAGSCTSDSVEEGTPSVRDTGSKSSPMTNLTGEWNEVGDDHDPKTSMPTA